MTKEEAKKMGATHYCDFYNYITYYRVGECIDLWDDNEWTYFDELSTVNLHDLKPL